MLFIDAEAQEEFMVKHVESAQEQGVITKLITINKGEVDNRYNYN